VTEPRRPPRDTQRSRLYRAETPVAGRRFETLADCMRFADSVVGTLWWEARFPERGLGGIPRLRPGQGARQAFYRVDPDGPTITLPRRYRTSGVLLHELAHWALDDDADLPNHGRTFARLLLDATAEFGGVARADALLASYREHRVHVGRPARLGPDGRWRYGWDERLRLGKGRALAIRFSTTGDPHAEASGVFEGYRRGASVLRLLADDGAVTIPARSVWDVRPVALAPLASGGARVAAVDLALPLGGVHVAVGPVE